MTFSSKLSLDRSLLTTLFVLETDFWNPEIKLVVGVRTKAVEDFDFFGLSFARAFGGTGALANVEFSSLPLEISLFLRKMNDLAGLTPLLALRRMELDGVTGAAA